MLLACLIAIGSVLLGALLGFWRRTSDEHLGPIKTFAFTAAVTVVGASFLPEALGSLGAWAFVPLALGFWGPRLLETAVARFGRAEHGSAVGLEVGYLGLALHQLGDGVGMGSLTGPAHAGHHHLDVFLAVGGHTVPLAAVVVLAFARAKGRAVAARRAAGLAVFVVTGVVLAGFLGVSVTSAWGGVTSAVIGGLLLHIATHDLGGALPKTNVARGIDLAAAVVGILVVAAGEREPGESGLDVGAALDASRTAGLATAPGLLVGLVVVVVLARRAHDAHHGVPRAHIDLAGAAIAFAALPLSVGLPFAVACVARAWRSGAHGHAPLEPSPAPSLGRAIERGVLGTVPWWALGVAGAGLVAAGALPKDGFGLDAIAALVVGLTSALGGPLGAVLAVPALAAGASDVAVLAGLACGAVASIVKSTAEEDAARSMRGRAFEVLAVVVPCAVGVATIVARPGLASWSMSSNGPVAASAAVIAAALAVWPIFALGVRGVAAKIFRVDHDHDHAHGGDHDAVGTCEAGGSRMAARAG